MGLCLDKDGHKFDHYYTRQFETYIDCETSCVKSQGFRGINIENDSICTCLYDDGLLYSSELGSTEPIFDLPDNYQGGASTVGGVGQIESSDGDRNSFCYRYTRKVSSFQTVNPQVAERSVFP